MSESRNGEDGGASHRNSTPAAVRADLDGAFDLLSDRRRRQVVVWVDEADTAVPVGGLAAGIAAAEGIDPARVRRALVHTHLPKLDECGVVEFDRTAGRVTPDRRFELLVRFVDAALGTFA